MTKIVLDDTNGGYNLSKINSNFDKIEAFVNNEALSRSNPTSSPNQMSNLLDMNGQHIINLPAPVTMNEPARLQDLINAAIGILPILPASIVTVVPGHGISSTNAQSALYELSDEVAAEVTARGVAVAAEAATRAAADVTLTNNVATNTTAITNINTDLGGLHNALITTGLYVLNIATLKTVVKTGNHNVATLGYYAAGDAGHGVYWCDLSDTTTLDNGGTVIVAADGGRWKLLHDKEVNVLQFGAKGIGSGFNDTTAFQKAVATGLKVRIPKSATYYYITDAIPCNTPGQQITGDGKDISIIQIDTGFNMAALGLFTVGSGEEGPQFKDFQVAYAQPDTASRGSLTTYPPTWYNQISPRSTMENIKVVRASYIYNMKNNAGACNFTGCEFSWFNVAIDIDGALDSIKIDRCHFWPFGLTANQQTIFYDASTIGVNSGRADDLHIDNCLFINGTQVNLYTSGFGITFGNITNTDFDTNKGINMASGQLQLAGCYFSASIASVISINVAGGTLAATSCKFSIGTTLTGAQISASAGVLMLSNSSFDTGAADMTCIGVSGATALISNCFFQRTANITPSKATINCASGRISVTGCRHSDKGTGAGAFINIVTDDLHCITGNAPIGWTITLPGVHTQLVSASNTS